MAEISNDTNPSPHADVPWSGLPEGVLGAGVACLVVVGVGAFFAYDGVHGAMQGLGAGFLITALVKGLAAVGVAGYLFFVRSDVPGMVGARQRVREHPEDVVWIFEKVTTSRNETRRSLSVGFVNGKIVEWALAEPLVEQPRIRSWIEQHLAHATTGYTEELRGRFNSSPRSLLRFQPGIGAS